MATSEAQRKKLIDDFKSKSATKKVAGGGTVSAATADEAKAIADKVEAAQQEATGQVEQAPEVEPVEPKTFKVLKSMMGSLTCYVGVFSMKDIVDYTKYARDLYEVEGGETMSGKDKEKKVDPSKSWQRTVNTDRAKNEISPYLQQPLHFFPPIVCVIADDGVALSADESEITVSGGSLAVLDGQHRKAGIEALFILPGVGPDSDFAKETVPVVILGTEVGIEERQQIFADVNRSAKVVSKALNILFDHRDHYAVIAQALADELKTTGGDSLVDLVRTVPTAKSSMVASLSNLYNLIVNFSSANAKKHAAPIRNATIDGKDTVIPAALIRDVALAVVQSLPSFDRLQANNDEYGKVRQAYICYSSTLFQAMGLALRHRLMTISPENWVEATRAIVSTTKFNADNPLWSQPGKEVIVSGKVGTRSEHVQHASEILETEWAKVTGLPGTAGTEQPTATPETANTATATA